MDDLKPCPFCGANFKMGQEPQDNFPVAGQFYIYHDYGPLGSLARLCPASVNQHFYTEAEAITAWNTRAPDPRLAEVTAERDGLRAHLAWYADAFCEQGPHSEVCGRLGPDECSGCRARAALGAKP